MDIGNSLPKMLTVKDIAEHLHIGINKAYAMVRLKGFPKIQIGNKFFIPEDKYLEWLNCHIRNQIIL